MSDLTNVFTNIADAIRAKTETQITYKPTEMADAINNISSNGLVYDNITGGSISGWLNAPVMIKEGVTSTYQMFYECYHFNQPVTIPNSVTSTFQMFYKCSRFNQPITIPDSVTVTEEMFSGCSNFNKPITIPDSVTNAVSMFANCRNFNQPVIIPNNVRNTYGILLNCVNFGGNVYVYPANLTRQSVAYMFNKCNNQLQKHIFTNDTNVFNGTSASQSITGTAITWTQDGDNYYNTDFNIYIHNVANPYTVLNNASYNFNSSSPLPDSPAIVFGSGVRSLADSFYTLLNSNSTLILFEEGVESLYECFGGQDYFNQPLTIPSSAVNCAFLVEGCSNFNSPVIFRNGVRSLLSTFDSCPSFDKDVWIPESVTNLQDTFYDCTAFESGSGIVHISHNIALGNTDNYIYNSLVNGYIGITLDPSRILNDY